MFDLPDVISLGSFGKDKDESLASGTISGNQPPTIGHVRARKPRFVGRGIRGARLGIDRHGPGPRAARREE